MVQRTVGGAVGRVFGVAIAVLLAAGGALADGAPGRATVVLRDGRRIEAAQVEFRERTFVVRAADGEELRLDERDVLRVELAPPAGAPRPQSVAQEVEVLHSPGRVLLTWRGPATADSVAFTLSRREVPDGPWTDVPVGSPTRSSAEDPPEWEVKDGGPAWPHSYEYRLHARTSSLGALPDVIVPVTPLRHLWVVPAGRSGDQVLIHVRSAADESPRRHLAVRPGEPILVDGRPIGAKVVAAVVEDGLPAIRVAWEGLAEPELIRADHVVGAPAVDRRTTLHRVEPAAASPAFDPARRIAVDLDDASQLDFARTVAGLTGLELALIAEANGTTIDLHLRSVGAEGLLTLGAELLGKTLGRFGGVRALSSARVALSERLAAPDGALAGRLDGERLAMWIAADVAFDLEDALELFRATTGIDVALSAAARALLDETTEPRTVFLRARAVTLAQALSLLTGARGLTWTTRGDVVLVKTPEELRPDEVWVDVDVPEGARLDALTAPLAAAGVRLSVRGPYGADLLRLPATKGRVLLPSLFAGLDSTWDPGRPVSLHVDGPAHLAGVCDLRALPGGTFELWSTQTSRTSTGMTLDEVARQHAGERMRVWAQSPAPVVDALRAARIEVVAVNNRPPPLAADPAPAPARASAEPRTLLDWKRIQASRPVETDAELKAAVEAARRAYWARGGEPDAHVALGRASMKFLFMGPEGLEVARQIFEVASSTTPGHAEARFHLGLCQALMGYPAAAFSSFAEALQCSLGNVDMLLSRAQLRVLLGQAPDAAQDVEAVVRSSPQRADGWACLAQVRSSIGDREGSLQALQEALKLGPDHPDAAGWRELLAKLGERPPAAPQTLEGTPR